MTVRSVIVGLFGAIFLCAAAYFNDAVMRQTMLVGNNFPVAVYGGLLLLLFLVNPFLRRTRVIRPFAGRELAVVLALTLAAASIPGSGLMRTFTSLLILPHHIVRTEAGWRDQRVLEMTPPRMLTDVSGEGGEDAVTGFIQGLGVGAQRIAFSDVPWQVWLPTLAFWIPLLLAAWLAVIGLALVVHRQWSDHEQLPYPIARFTAALLPGSNGAAADIMRSRLFWTGAAVIFSIHMLNYAVAWFPRTLVSVQLQFNFYPMQTMFPTFARAGSFFLFHPRLYFTVIALAFLLASDVSLSLGIGPIVFAYITGALLGVGVSLTAGGYMSPNAVTFLNFGAYMGLFLMLLYTGRHYYVEVFGQALGIRRMESRGDVAVWGGRLFLAAFVTLTALLTTTGLDWQIALLYAMGLMVIYLVMGRIIAETGLFFIQPYTFPCVVLWGMLGVRAMGPQTMLILLLISGVFLVDPREALMPFLVNSIKTLDLTGGRIGKTAVWCVAALMLGLAVAIPVQLYLQYDRGANMADAWATRVVPSGAFNQAVRIRQRLVAQGTLDAAEAIDGWTRFSSANPAPDLLLAFGVGLALVGLFAACRLRFPRWPLHPVMFLVWTSYPGQVFAISFLIGSLLKRTVTKYGGAAVYRKLQPLMFGVIAGEMCGGLVPAIIGAVYFFVTGGIPRGFSIMPG